uniref:G-protein coupled receptors family 1 profile domain-containing protein n=1 Tax=Sphenodon punctatus TaxID=8508 RepID=A0A8D0GSF3_SPHPU
MKQTMGNLTMVTQFILLGIPHTEGQQTILFFIFLAFYLCTLLGNLLIMTAVVSDSRLHTPMYFFLCNLSILDIGFSSVSTPKALANLWAQSRTISWGGCMSQVFFYHFLGSTECLLYTVMAYDRYVAICHPLRYLIIMNWKVCTILAAGTWITSSFHATILTSLTFTLPYCGPRNEVDYIFCDIPAVLKLSCAETSLNEMVTMVDVGVVAMTCFLLILTSYVYIISAILRIRTADGQHRAFSTCTAHISVVLIYYVPLVFIYLRPGSRDPLDGVVAVFYTTVTPLLNPIIYTLRNKEMKAAVMRLMMGGGEAGGEA